MKIYKNIALGLAFVAIFGIGVSVALTNAQSPNPNPNPNPNPSSSQTPLSGWAWSSTIGWLSFNSSDSGAGGGGTYSVVLATSSANPVGTLSGYAWSPNIGWIKFGGLAGQTVGGLTTTDASVDPHTGSVTGWARACAGTAAGDCSSMTSRADGWDGWIELSGNNHATGDITGNSGVTLDSNANSSTYGHFKGFAWGGTNVGWLDFYPNTTGCTGSGCGVTINPNPNQSGPSLSLTGDQANLSTGAPQVLILTVHPIISTSNISSSETVQIVLGSPTLNGVSTGDITAKFIASDLNWPSICTASAPLFTTATCQVTPTTASASLPVKVTLINTTNPSTPYNVPISATWTAGPNPQPTNIVVNVNTGSGNATLKAHYTAADAGSTAISIKQGSDAYLSWDMGLDPASYECLGQVTPSTTYLNTIWVNPTQGLGVSSASYLQVSNAANPLSSGTYTFQIGCSPISTSGFWNIFKTANAASGNFTSNPATIKVYTSSEQEI